MFVCLVAVFSLAPFCSVFAGNATGVDSIVDLAGIERPEEWATWNEQEKFSYLQSYEIYPEGRKYQGSFDMPRYFASLGVEQPDNWLERTSLERKEFIAGLQKDIFPVTEEVDTPASDSESGNTLLAILVIFGGVLGAYFLEKKRRALSISALGVGRILELVCYYVLPIVLTASLFAVSFESMKAWGVLLGKGSLILFVAIMFIKPFSRFFPRVGIFMRIVAWRKELGIAVFYLAFFHTLAMFMSTGLLATMDEWFGDITDPAFMGSLSLLIMFVLYLTSNSFSIQKMRQNWKKLHYFAYPALLFALMHKFGVEEGTFVPAFVVFGIFVVLKIVEFLKVRKLRQKK